MGTETERLVIVMSNQNKETYGLIVGDRAHKIAALLSRQEMPSTAALRAKALTDAGLAVFAKHPVTSRPRESRFQAITAAGVYLNRFRPSAPWALLGAELRSGKCIFDLVYKCERGVLIDEIKLGVNRSNEAEVREQIDRYLVEGRKIWANEFLGVRLCAVDEPIASRLYSPTSKRSSLVSQLDISNDLRIR